MQICQCLYSTFDPCYGNGDLLAVDYDDSGATPDIHYSYTRTGQQDIVSEGQFAAAAFTAGQVFTPSLSPSLSTSVRSTDYAYNSRFQATSETVSGLLSSDAVLTRTYEEIGTTIGRSSGYSLSAPSAISAVNYSYDTAGRLQTVSDGTDTFTYGYTANTRNLLASMTGPVHTVSYSYEPGRNAMTGIENKETVGTESVVSNYTYSYNELGQRADREQSGSAFSSTTKDTFSYDYLGQVTASTNDTLTATEWNPTYFYDEIGNRQSSTGVSPVSAYTSNALNQYTAIDAVNPTYDSDGNLTDDGTWAYSWNGENRLISATDGSITIDFTYDYQARLVEKHDGTNVEVYLYDGWNRIATFDVQPSTFSLAKRFLWGLDLSGSMQGAGGVGGLLKETKNEAQGTTNYYCLYDANGNIVQKLNSSGVASMAVEYDPFGNIISGSLVGEYGFSTKPLIDGILMYYYGFRYYDPVTGRWPSRDPIQEQGGLNLYIFAGNDGPNNIDLLGLLLTEYTTDYTALRWGSHNTGDLGQTRSNWPLTIANRSLLSKKVTISGSLSITFSLRSDISSKHDTHPYACDQTQSIAQHEYEHARIFKEKWNQLKRVADNFEGKYCKRKCAKIAKDMANAYSDFVLNQAREEHNAFHNRVGCSPEHPMASFNRARAHTKIKDLRKEFNDEDCSYP